MIEINKVSDIIGLTFPGFILSKLFGLLNLYETDSLEAYGGIVVLQSKDDVAQFKNKTPEFTEKIRCKKTVVWHATFPINNSHCKEVYVDDSLLDESTRLDWENNLTRTVYEIELQ
jgi:hypothetical protein